MPEANVFLAGKSVNFSPPAGRNDPGRGRASRALGKQRPEPRNVVAGDVSDVLPHTRRETEAGPSPSVGSVPACRHKRALGACSLRASAVIEAVVRTGPRCRSQGGNERHRPPIRALLLSPTSRRPGTGHGGRSGLLQLPSGRSQPRSLSVGCDRPVVHEKQKSAAAHGRALDRAVATSWAVV